MTKTKETTYKLLNCTNCTTEFSIPVTDYKRRIRKLPDSTNFFCNRSCSASHRNRNRVDNGKHLKQYRFKQNNTKRQLYDQQYTWYIHRLTTDSRDHNKYAGDRLELQTMLQAQWSIQGGTCALSGQQLELRVGAQGTTTDKNPFKIASLDRIDNSKPYELGNIQWVSVSMNQARGSLELDLFKKYLLEFRKP